MATLTSPLTGIADVVAQAQRLQVRILHLGSLLPRFLQSSDGQHRFSPVLFDFRYFIDSATAEARIESSRHLQSLDEEMKGGYGTFLAKLWDLYARAVHLQQQAQQPVSMQLVALLGSVLLLLDVCVPSTARERSIVAHIRLNTGSQTVSRQAAAIVRLFAATGFEESVAKVPTGYPEQYLARCKLPKSAVQILITQFLTLPNLTPSAAASQLYIALYFVPEGLHGDSDLMKAAVSKGFRQSWVITWAPGHLADVSLQWQRYRAARNALGAVLTASKAKDIAVACKCKMNECQRTLNELIQGQADKGVWSAEKSKLSAAVAKQSIDKDAVIRLLLDSAYLESWTQSASIDCMAKQWRGHCVSIAAKLDAAAAASVASGPTQYHGSRHQPAYQDAEEQTQQLSQSVSTAELKGLAEQVRTLQVGDSSGVQQLQLALEGIPSSSSSSAESPALEGQTSSSPQDPFAEATGSHSFRPTADPWDPWAEPSHQQLSSSPYYRLGSSDSDWDEQYQYDDQTGLAASHAEIQETLAQEADLGYAWGLMGGYTQQLQLQIRTDPKAIPKVSALLVKLRSVMTPSLTSLSALEADDADAAAAEVVSHFTRRLLHLAQSVLKVVPVIFFKVLDGVVALHQGHNLILPDRLEKPEVSKYAHLQARAELAKLAQTAAAYSRNLRAFDSDAVAPQKHDAMISLKLDVSQGIAARTARACTRTLTFTQPAASLLVQDPPQAGGLLAGVAGGLAGSSGDPVNRNELSAQLAQLTQELNTLKSSFQSMQDFTQLPTPQKMMYSGLPKHADPAQRTFLRVCLAELLRLTNPTQSQFQPLLCGWYTAEGDEVVGLRGFRGLRQALGVTGVRCLDRLLEIRIQNAMRQLSAILVLAEHDVDLSKLDTSQSARSSHRIAPDPAAFKEAVRSGSKLWPIMSHYLAALGQASLIRQRLASDLRTSERLLTAGKGNSRDTDSAPMPSNSHAQLDGKHAEQGTSSQPDSHEQKLHQQMPEQLPKQEQGSGRMQLGISDAEIPQVPGQIDCPEPSQASESQPGVLMLLCVLSLMSRCSFNGRLGILERLRSSQGSSDLYAVMQGLVVWLDAQAMHQYQAVLHTANQYISAYTQVATSATALSVQAAGIQIGLPAEIGRLLAFLQQVNTATGSGRSLLKQFLPPFLLDNWQCLVLSEKGF
ncbi:hypothetical protein WJX79_007774 [Trebouxia sp. C0005]